MIIRRFNLFVWVVLLLCGVESFATEMRLLMSIFRHGNRYPMPYRTTRFFYPLNPHANVSWFPDSDEGLTVDGKRNAYEFGLILREKYGSWLGPNYSKNLVEFRSSNFQRAAVSAALVAAGLFPPIEEQRWNGKLIWQPIPVMSVSHEHNPLFFGGLSCMKYYVKYLETKLTDRTIVAYDVGMRQFYRNISRHTGAPVNNKILYFLHMEFLALVSGGLEPPDWADGSYPHGNLTEAAIMEFLFSSWNDDLKRLTGGPWLKEWLGHVDAHLNVDVERPTGSSKKKTSPSKKAFFYGGHDVNVAGILITLGIYYPHVPNYVSAVNFELHEDNDRQFYVKVLHRDSDEFIEYVVPGCDVVLCPLETFRKIFAGVIPKNLTEECGPNISNLIV